jgi:hypothetical protein
MRLERLGGGSPETIPWLAILMRRLENCNDEFFLRGDDRVASRKPLFPESVDHRLWNALTIQLIH